MADLSAFPSKMVLLDCETTGGRADHDRMTELALIVVTEGRVSERWQTLLNPGIAIPPWITRLTGISDDMVAKAPRFEDIAESLSNKLEDSIIVAHNARFDYSFLKQAFLRCGRSLNNKTLCSVRLSRLFFPEHRHHGLDRIIERLGLILTDRHRAMADTEVILAFLEHIGERFSAADIEAGWQQLTKRPSLPSHIAASQIDALPEAPGIYRFYDAEGSLLYIGKSINIRDRVLSHFSQDHKNKKALDISSQLHQITFERTASDFGAQMLENSEIKQYSPRYNRRQTKIKKLYQLVKNTNAEGFHTLECVLTDRSAIDEISQRYGLFRSRKQAQEKILQLTQDHQLCQKLCGLEKRQRGSCFAYQLKKCRGACCGEEATASYNLRLELALQTLKNQQWPWPGPILVEEFPLDETKGDPDYHLIDQWRYLGRVRDETDCYQRLQRLNKEPTFFDKDSYRILLRFLLKPHKQAHHHLQIKPLHLDSETWDE